MRSIYSVLAVFVVLSLIAALPAFARIPVRQSSDNGIDSSANAWKLTGRTDAQPYTANGKKALIVRESICPNQDRSTGYCRANPATEAATTCSCFNSNRSNSSQPTPASAFKSDAFWLRSERRGPNLWRDGLSGIRSDSSASNNTLELCTTDPADPTFQNLPDISFTHNASNTR